MYVLIAISPVHIRNENSHKACTSECIYINRLHTHSQFDNATSATAFIFPILCSAFHDLINWWDFPRKFANKHYIYYIKLLSLTHAHNVFQRMPTTCNICPQLECTFNLEIFMRSPWENAQDWLLVGFATETLWKLLYQILMDSVNKTLFSASVSYFK